MFSSGEQRATANSWNISTTDGTDLNTPTSIVFANSKYVAVGIGGYDSNGLPASFTEDPVKYNTSLGGAWLTPSTNLSYINFTRIRFLNNKFLAVGFSSGGIAYICDSTDAVTWNLNTVYTGASKFNYPVDIAWDGTNYVVGTSGSTSVYRSPDLTTWTAYTLGSSNFINTITYAAGLFVAPTRAFYAWTSPDGATWTLRTIQPTSPVEPTIWNDIIYANSRFVVCGKAFDSSKTNTFATSTDGITWTMRTAATTGANFTSITYALGLFVAVGPSVNTSSDGITWTQYIVPATPNGVAVTNTGSQFIFVALNQRYATSTNGSTWVSSPTVSGDYRAVASGTKVGFLGPGNTMFVAGGTIPSGTKPSMAYSYDGIGWAPCTVTASYGYSVFAITYSNGEFITNAGLRSSDGVTFAPSGSAVNNAGCIITTSVPNLVYASYGETNTTSDFNIYRSTDNGLTWAINYTHSTNVGFMVYAAGRIVAVVPNGGVVLVNTNLTSGWYSYSPGIFRPKYIVYASGQFYIIGQPSGGGSYEYATSLNGETWSKGTLTLPSGFLSSNNISGLTYRNGLYVMISQASSSSGTAKILTSTDGITYTVKKEIDKADFDPAVSFVRLNSVTNNPETFIAVGLNLQTFSTN